MMKNYWKLYNTIEIDDDNEEIEPEDLNHMIVYVIDPETKKPKCVKFPEYDPKIMGIGFAHYDDCEDFVLSMAVAELLDYLSKSFPGYVQDKSIQTASITTIADEDALLALKWFARCFDAGLAITLSHMTTKKYDQFKDALQVAVTEVLPSLTRPFFVPNSNGINEMKKIFMTVSASILFGSLRFHFKLTDLSLSKIDRITHETAAKRLIHYFSAEKYITREEKENGTKENSNDTGTENSMGGELGDENPNGTEED